MIALTVLLVLFFFAALALGFWALVRLSKRVVLSLRRYTNSLHKET